MEGKEVQQKKPYYKIKAGLREHLKQYSRLDSLPISYEELMDYEELLPIYDDKGKSTLWYYVLYAQSEIERIHDALIAVYQRLVSDGDMITYLKVGSIDFCSFGNSKPIRVKIVNEINDNHDYFYMKQADASRIYGLELEEIFSPDKINYLVDKNTLVEDHIVGIPVDEFLTKNQQVKVENRLRLAKEFVKFNERCFVRLLGDMRGYNFVVEIIQDFDNVQYRLRAMDFDQQCYEGRINMYRPQFYKDNIELVNLAQELMSVQVADQYRRTERVAMKKRYLSNRQRTKSLLRIMKKDLISIPKHIETLKVDLAKFHNDSDFIQFNTMGEILNLHLEKSLGVQILSIG